jgi:hypothetical protein
MQTPAAKILGRYEVRPVPAQSFWLEEGLCCVLRSCIASAALIMVPVQNRLRLLGRKQGGVAGSRRERHLLSDPALCDGA